MFLGPANVTFVIILGLLMTFVFITVSRLLAPRIKGIPEKFTIHECGERPVGSTWHLHPFEKPCSTVEIVKRFSFVSTLLFKLYPSGKEADKYKVDRGQIIGYYSHWFARCL